MTDIAPDWTDVIADAELAAGGQHAFIRNRVRILVCRSDAGLRAMEDRCPHASQYLLGGKIAGASLRCPRHGATFDLASGKPLNDVTDRCLKFFDVRVREGRIEVGAELAPT